MRLVQGLVPCFLCLALPSSVGAASISFFDLTDTVTTQTDDTSGRISFSCAAAEQCTATVLPPAGTFEGLFTGSAVTIYEDASLTVVSDTIFFDTIPGVTGLGITVNFRSDSGEGFLPPLGAGTTLVENGLLQQTSTITWRNADHTVLATDTVFFQSDVDVPEPATAALILSGLPFLGLAFRRLPAA